MATGFAFTISLNDMLTAPAKRVAGALVATSKTALTLEKQAQSLEKRMVQASASMNFKAYAQASYQLEAVNAALARTDKGFADLAEPAKAATNAVLALTAATVGLVVEGAKFTLEASQQKSAAVEMFTAMAGGKKAGDELFSMMEGLATQLPQTKDQLTAWSKSFMAMGVLKQGALREELRATAASAALMGDSGSEAFTTLSKKIQESVATTGKLKLADKQIASLAATGANITDVAAKMGVSVTALTSGLKRGTVDAAKFNQALSGALIQKGAGPIDRMTGSLTVMEDKFKEAIGDIFEDVDVSPFIDSMKDLLGAFTQGTESGKTMKTVFGGFFTSFFQLAGKGVTVAKNLFYGMIIFGLKAYIAVKPFIPFLKALAMVVGVAGTAFAVTLIPALWASVVALGSLIATAAVAAAPFLAIGALVVGVYEAFTHWSDIKAIALKAFDWVGDLTANLIDGLVNGIRNGTGIVIDAIKGLGHSAMSALKGVLGIHSPSKEFEKLGKFTAHGFSRGMTVSAPMVAGSAAVMASAAAGGASSASRASLDPRSYVAASAGGGAAAGGSRSSSGLALHFAPGAIVISGVAGAEELTEQAISLIFEKVALAQGLLAGGATG